MANVATISATAKIDTKNWTRSAARMRQDAKSMSAASSASFAKVAATVAAVAAAFYTARRAASALLQVMGEIDKIAKLADRLNATTEGLRSLGLAAQLTGTETSALNKGMEIFTQRIGEARQGVGEAVDVFESLNIDPDTLALMDTVEALKLVSDRMKALPTQADKMTASADLFGRSGRQMVNLLELGADGISAIEREAALLGGTFSSTFADGVEEANDSMTRLSFAWEGLKNSMAGSLAKIILPVVEGLNSLIKWLNRPAQGWFTFGEALPTEDINALADSARKAGGYVDGLSDAFDDAGQSIEELDDLAVSLSNHLQDMARADSDSGWQVFMDVQTPLEQFERELRNLDGLVTVGAISWETYSRAVRKAIGELDSATQSQQNFEAASNRQTGAALRHSLEAFGAVADARAAQGMQRQGLALDRERNALLRQQLEASSRRTGIPVEEFDLP